MRLSSEQIVRQAGASSVCGGGSKQLLPGGASKETFVRSRTKAARVGEYTSADRASEGCSGGLAQSAGKSESAERPLRNADRDRRRGRGAGGCRCGRVLQAPPPPAVRR